MSNRVIDTDSANYKLRKILKANYEDAWEAKRNGEPVGWSASVFPIEIPATLGLHVVYPENQAAAIASRGAGERMCLNSESRGYSNDLCAYARINLSYLAGDKCEEQPMPQPDYLLCCTNICSCIFKWYENMAREKNIPLILIDVPFSTGKEISEEAIEYVSGQFWDAVRRLEEITGKKWSDDKFKEVMKNVRRSGNAWMKCSSIAAMKPSPLNGFDLLNHMAAMVTSRAYPETGEALEQLYEEYKANAAEHKSTFKGEEKYRIMVEGISCWPYVRATMEGLLGRGINMVTTTYVDSFCFVYDDFRGMIHRYCYQQNAIGIEMSVEERERRAREFGLDGYLIHTNRSCKVWTGFMSEVGRTVKKNCDIAVTSFDGDQADPRNFSLAQYNTRVQGLTEIMEMRKE